MIRIGFAVALAASTWLVGVFFLPKREYPCFGDGGGGMRPDILCVTTVIPVPVLIVLAIAMALVLSRVFRRFDVPDPPHPPAARAWVLMAALSLALFFVAFLELVGFDIFEMHRGVAAVVWLASLSAMGILDLVSARALGGRREPSPT